MIKLLLLHPVSVQDNMEFVVDLSHLDKPQDIRADDLGSWTFNDKRCSNCDVEDDIVLLVGHVMIKDAQIVM